MRVLVQMTSNGIGDTVLGLTSVAGLRATTNHHITYQVQPHRVEWASLFADAHEVVAAGTPVTHERLYSPFSSYSLELEETSRLPRWEYYANACDTVARKPTPKNIEPNARHAGCVVLVPYCDWAPRRWPLRHWCALERQLRAAGEEVLILDGPGDGSRTSCFASMRYWGFGAEVVASLLVGAKLVIGADTGITHLAGALGKRTIALCGPTAGDKIFGVYSAVTSLRGALGCGGCYWRGPHWLPECDTACAELATILPGEVLDVALSRKTPLPVL